MSLQTPPDVPQDPEAAVHPEFSNGHDLTNGSSSDNWEMKEKKPEAVSVAEKAVPTQNSSPALLPPKSSDSEPPDGGFRAWLVVFGAMWSTFTTIGYANSWGVFQEYYTQNILENTSASNIAWIGSIQYAFIFLPGVPVGRLFDLGYFHSILIPASALLMLATFLIPQCKTYWEFLLCQGLATGLACGAFFGPVTAVLATWFKKKRSLAMGVFACGSAIGGTVIPIAVRNLIPKVGFPWAVRIIGFILLTGLLLANLTLKRRVKAAPSSEGVFNMRMLKQFKSPAFTAYCMSSFFIYLGFYTLLTYVGETASSIGASDELSFYLVSIANASSGVGRVFAGWTADKIGALNVLIPLTVLTGVMTLIWPFMTSSGALIVITVIYGFSSGSYVALVTMPVIETGEPGDTNRDMGRRIGLLLTFFAFGAILGPPLSGQVLKGGGFDAMGIYAGCMILFGVAIMCLGRFLVLNSRRKRASIPSWIVVRV